MQKIKITNKTLEQKIRLYAIKHKISFQKACEKLFDAGVCHLQKKDANLKSITDSLDLVVGDDIVLFSSVTKLGREEILQKIEDLTIEIV